MRSKLNNLGINSFTASFPLVSFNICEYVIYSQYAVYSRYAGDVIRNPRWHPQWHVLTCECEPPRARSKVLGRTTFESASSVRETEKRCPLAAGPSAPAGRRLRPAPPASAPAGPRSVRAGGLAALRSRPFRRRRWAWRVRGRWVPWPRGHCTARWRMRRRKRRRRRR